MYAARTPPGNPPCDTCRVELFDNNADVAEIYMLTRGQMITIGPENKPIDLNLSAVASVMLMDRKQRRQLLKIQNLWHYFNNEGGE